MNYALVRSYQRGDELTCSETSPKFGTQTGDILEDNMGLAVTLRGLTDIFKGPGRLFISGADSYTCTLYRKTAKGRDHKKCCHIDFSNHSNQIVDQDDRESP